MPTRKKLIEVALPLEKINAASAREKSIRHGHPSTLHLWWARRPLAAARAVIFAQMVDDPSAWPELFPTEEAQETERQRLFRLIEELVKWENTTNEALLQQARDEIWKSWRRTCAENQDHPRAADLFNPEKLPAFHDPFAGGGALPLEAQRLGLEAYASDLNPVAVLINKAMIEIPPKFAGMPPVCLTAEGAEGRRGSYVQNPLRTSASSAVETVWRGAQGLAEDVRYYGQWMRDEAERRIGHLYPKIKITAERAEERRDLLPYVGKELTVIAWLWARTVKSPNPAFRHVDVPLASTFMLSTKAGKEAYVEPVIAGDNYRFTVRVGKPKDPVGAKNGTKLARGANFRCLMSDAPIAGDYIKAEGQAGRMGARLMAIVAEGDRGRVYLAPTAEHEAIARQAQPQWAPDVAMPDNPRWFSPPLYGLTTFGDLFTPRQLVALNTFADLVGEARERVRRDYLGARASRPPSPHAGWHSRGYHPHLDQPDMIQSITFRLHDSVPSALLQQWRDELRIVEGLTGDDARMVELRRRLEAYEDAGYGTCYLRDPKLAALVEQALLHFDGQRYRLLEWCIMPNHVHVLIQTLLGYPLSDIIHSWKSFTAKEANRLLGRSGAFWMADYYDRYVRDERHLAAARAYIRENPVKAGLCVTAEEWRWSSAGVGAGGTPAHPGVAGVGAGGAGGTPAHPGDDLPLSAGGTGATAYAEAVGVYLAFAISRSADRGSNICSWDNSPKMEALRNTFGRQAIPMVWDFAEGNPLSESSGNWMNNVEWGAKTVVFLPAKAVGTAKQIDATSQETSNCKVVSTDPPYYDNIGYADLSDFFYVWLRRTLRPVFPDLFATLAVPKAEELVATPYRQGGKEQAEKYFLNGMTEAMKRLAEQTHPVFPATIYYAFKQSETPGARASGPHADETSALPGTVSTGWETFLDAVIRAGFAISGTWPMRTELGNRMIGSGTNALASSIILVCRPRSKDAPAVTRRDFVAALKAELPAALKAMQRGNIAPVDLAQAAIGPGMAIFTRYGKVIDASGKPLSVREALALINATLDEVLAEQEGDFDAETRWAVTWFEQYGFAESEYGVAETLAVARNTSVRGMAEAGILVSRGGKVRLLKPKELPAGWDPDLDFRLTVWETVHHLVRVLAEGEQAAADLLAKLGARADAARELAYRLYAICERKKRAAEALAYNSLVQSWPEMARLAGERRSETPVQQGMEL